MRVQFHLCFYFFCLHRGPGFRAAKNCKRKILGLHSRQIGRTIRVRCMTCLTDGFSFYAFRFHRNGIRAGKFSLRCPRKWGSCLPWNRSGYFSSISPSDFSTSCPLVPLFALAAHLSRIEFRPLRLRCCLDFVVFSARSRNSNQNTQAPSRDQQ